MRAGAIVRSTTFFVILYWTSLNVSAQWVQQPGPFTGSVVTSMFLDGDLMMVGTQDSGSYRSRNGGSEWTRIKFSSDTISHSRACFTKSAMTIVAGVFSEGVYHSEDEGDTWTSGYNQFRDPSPPALLTNSLVTLRNKIWALGGGSYTSVDTGKSWSFFYDLGNINATGVVETESATYISAKGSFSDRDTLLVFAAGVYKSTNDGVSWSRCNQGLPSGSLTCLATSSGYLYAGAWPGVAVSDDGGSSWSISGDRNLNSKIQCVLAEREKVFAGTYDHGVIYSPDYGVTWRTFGTGLDNVNVYSLVSDSKTLFACTNKGLFCINIASTVFVQADDDASSAITVTPNPSERLVTITCAHAGIDPGSIRVTDMLGNCISAVPFLVNSVDPQSVTMDVSTFSNGVYSIQIETARGLEYARVMVVK